MLGALSVLAATFNRMGFFDLDTDGKARRFAEKKGVDVSGAVAVGRGFGDGAERVMVVYPDRVEVHHLGRVGSVTRKGAGTVSLPRDRVGSVSTRREGMAGVVSVHGSGEDVDFPTDLATRDRLADAVRAMLAESPAASAPAAPPPPPAVPAGWYPAGDVQRYWDGSAWTDHTAPLA